MRESPRLWDWLAGIYDRRAHEDEDLVRAAERCRAHLGADDVVLDFACGSGPLALRLAADVREVHGIDTSARMIELARERASSSGVRNVRFERRSLFDADLARDPYDAVLAFNILHLVDDPGAILRRAGALLRPGGLVISSTPCLANGKTERMARMCSRLVTGIGLLPNLRVVRAEELTDTMTGAGLRVVEAESTGDAVKSVYLVARRPVAQDFFAIR